MPRHPSRVPRLALLAALTLLSAGATGCGGAPGAAGPSPPASLARVIATRQHDPLVSIFQTDHQLHADPAGTLDLLRSYGVGTIRVLMPWGVLNGFPTLAPSADSPTPPAGFNGTDPAAYTAAAWADYDTIVRDAAARGIRVYLTLSPPPPLWARGSGDPGHPTHPQWRPSAGLFGQFVAAVGTRYSGRYTPPGASSPLPRVSMWGIWNEPNFGPWLAPQSLPGSKLANAAGLYRPLLDAGYAGLGKTGHAADTILVGELAPRGISLAPGPGAFGYTVPLRFLRALYCVDDSLHQLRGADAGVLGCPQHQSAASFAAAHPGLFHATGLAIHPYEFGPPDVPTPGEPDYADLAALPRVERAIDSITALYGVGRRLPIYNTEFGYETNPPETAVGTVTPPLAAAYMNQSEYISWRDLRVQSYDQYLLIDSPNREFATGLEFPSGAPKPSMGAYLMPIWLPHTTAAPGHALEIWGCVRPAGRLTAGATSPQSVEIQFARAGAATGSPFRTIATRRLDLAGGYYDFEVTLPGAGSVRAEWSPASGPAIFSRVVTVSAAR